MIFAWFANTQNAACHATWCESAHEFSGFERICERLLVVGCMQMVTCKTWRALGLRFYVALRRLQSTRLYVIARLAHSVLEYRSGRVLWRHICVVSDMVPALCLINVFWIDMCRIRELLRSVKRRVKSRKPCSDCFCGFMFSNVAKLPNAHR